MDDDLKNIWSQVQSDIELEDDQIDELIYQESSGLIDRIIKTIKTEHIFNMISFPIFLVVFLYFGMYLETVLTTIVFGAVIIYYQKLISKLRLGPMSMNVHNYLISSYERLKRFVAHYKITSALVFVISFVITLKYEIGWGDLYKSIMEENMTDSWPIMVAVISGLIIGIALTQLIVTILYSKKIKALKTLISDLENL